MTRLTRGDVGLQADATSCLCTTEHSCALLSCGGGAGSQPSRHSLGIAATCHLVLVRQLWQLGVVLCVMVDVCLSVSVLASCGGVGSLLAVAGASPGHRTGASSNKRSSVGAYLRQAAL